MISLGSSDRVYFLLVNIDVIAGYNIASRCVIKALTVVLFLAMIFITLI